MGVFWFAGLYGVAGFLVDNEVEVYGLLWEVRSSGGTEVDCTFMRNWVTFSEVCSGGLAEWVVFMN